MDGTAPPKDYGKWYDLICELLRHCVERYGTEEANSWYWELWNEPDIFYWQGSLEEYCKLYDYTTSAIEAVLPDTRIGGPATTGPNADGNSAAWLDRFLDHCVNGRNYHTGKNGTRLDFVSFHAKGGSYRPAWGKPCNMVEKQTPSTRNLLSQVKLGLEIIEKYPSLKGVRCILTECDTDGWAAGGIWDNPNLRFRNTEYYPSYVVTVLKKLIDLAEDYGRELDALTWAFMFEGERTFEGTRTFTTNGIDKPILNLFRMLSHLGNTRLQFSVSSMAKSPLNARGTDEAPHIDGIAAMSENKSVEVLLFSHHDDWDVYGEYDVKIEVANLPFANDSVILAHYRIDKNHSNAHTEWVRQGCPSYPTPSQAEMIKSRQELELYEPRTQVPLMNGKLEKTISLPVHGISLLILAKE